MACGVTMSSMFASMQQLRPFDPCIRTHIGSVSIHLSYPRQSFRIQVRRVHVIPLRVKYYDGETSSPEDQEPPQEAVLKAISEVSKTEGRVAQTTNVVIGGTVTDDSTKEWLALDQKTVSARGNWEFLGCY